MTSPNTCHTCKFFSAAGSECRYNAPVVGESPWPHVGGKNDWCRMWERGHIGDSGDLRLAFGTEQFFSVADAARVLGVSRTKAHSMLVQLRKKDEVIYTPRSGHVMADPCAIKHGALDVED